MASNRLQGQLQMGLLSDGPLMSIIVSKPGATRGSGTVLGQTGVGLVCRYWARLGWD